MKHGVYLIKKEGQRPNMVIHRKPMTKLNLDYFLRNVCYVIPVDSFNRDELQILLDNESKNYPEDDGKYILMNAFLDNEKKTKFIGLANKEHTHIDTVCEGKFLVTVVDDDCKGFTQWNITEREAKLISTRYNISIKKHY